MVLTFWIISISAVDPNKEVVHAYVPSHLYFVLFELIKVQDFKAFKCQFHKMIKHNQFVGFCRRIVWVYLTIFCGWDLKG